MNDLKDKTAIVSGGSDGIGLAIARNRELADYLVEHGYDFCAHGFRWIDYQFVEEKVEREHIKDCISILTEFLGKRPEGWYTGRNSPNTRKLIIEEGGFLYDSDSYSDDLPYFEKRNNKKQLIVPYTLDNNDMRFATNQGFNSGDQFYNYLKDSFDVLYKEGETNPKMMSVGLHCRIVGKPGRLKSLERFLDYVLEHKDVWICKRIDIAKHWIKNYSNI